MANLATVPLRPFRRRVRRMAHAATRALHPINVLQRELVLRGIWRPSHFDGPDFLGIGAPQTGTTWLYQNLRRHPEIALPARKEVGYFGLRRRFGPCVVGLSH